MQASLAALHISREIWLCGDTPCEIICNLKEPWLVYILQTGEGSAEASGGELEYVQDRQFL